MKSKSIAALILISVGCSPLKTSPHDEKHQLELTLHNVQTHLDDLRHDINCFQTEMQILDGRIKYYENALTALKHQDLEKHQIRIDQIAQQLLAIEKKLSHFEKSQDGSSHDVHQLASHANETNAALTQFKSRLQELEDEILGQNRRFDELAKLKGTIETLAKNSRGSDSFKIYKVRPGDSLEKIARAHKTAVDRIKKLNGLEQDLIVAGQELKIPND